MRLGQRLLALALVLLGCGGAGPSPTGTTAEPAASSGPRGSLILATREEIREALGEATPPACLVDTLPIERCHEALPPVLRDLLERAPGQEPIVALLDALARRNEPGGELELALAVERAHDAGGEAAWLGDVIELGAAVVTMAAAANSDDSVRSTMLARGLPSPCPRLAGSVPTMDDGDRRAALARAEGPCALACPQASPEMTEAGLARACGPAFFGVTDAADAPLFAGDSMTLLAVRGLTHALEAVRRLRAGPQTPPVRALLERATADLAHVAIPARIPATISLGTDELTLPAASSAEDGLAPVLVVLGPESIHVGARPWIGVSDDALVRMGDAVPGPPLAREDASVIAAALDDALDRAWRAPAIEVDDEEEAEAPQWIDESGTPVTPAAAGPTPVEIEIVADSALPLERLGAVLTALDAARPTDAREPGRTLRALVHLRVTLPDGRRGRVRLVSPDAASPRSDGVLGYDPWRADRLVRGGAAEPLGRWVESVGDGTDTIGLAILSTP